jgi:hypothetical protein
MVGSKVTPANLTGYDYYKYPWAVAALAKNATYNSELSYNVSSVFRTPVVVKVGKITTTSDGVTSTESDALALDILIDTYNYVKVWDGRFGSGRVEDFIQGVPTINTTTGEHQLPPSVFPFPQGPNDSRTGGGGVSVNTLYTESKPAFALSNYLSAFALVNSSGIKAQIYLLGKNAVFTPFNNQSFTLVLDGNGETQFAKVGFTSRRETF